MMAMLSKKIKNAYKWSYHEVMSLKVPEPFDIRAFIDLKELDAPDGSTAFLILYGGFNESAGDFTYYGIEAPRNCPMRHAFEWGELTWNEYWTHKDFLYRIVIPFDIGPVTSEIISPREMSENSKSTLSNIDHLCPYEIKRRTLQASTKWATNSPQDQLSAEREYQQFMIQFGHRIPNRAA